MTEQLLHYIWQYQYFNTKHLRTTGGENILVIHPGIHNKNQGPDFLSAKLKIGDTTWAGNVELHVHSREWNEHEHSLDDNYRNVILHVVWMDGGDTVLDFPTLELQAFVPKLLLDKYRLLMEQPSFIACENHISAVDNLTIIAWKDRLVAERLEQRALQVEQLLEQCNGHWEQCCLVLLARNFGMKVNTDAFQKIMASIPFAILQRHRSQLIQLEALLFGQAGLLEREFSEAYPAMLKKEYAFLAKKYNLKSAGIPLFFLRMRPANFPTIRLAQLAALIHNNSGFFSMFTGSDDLHEVAKIFAVEANDYWLHHYVFDETSAYRKKSPGKQMIVNIFLNTIIPLLFSYGKHYKKEDQKVKAMRWLNKLPPEANSITAGFVKLKVENSTASDSQALLQLRQQYCDHKKCLHCAVGNAILKKQVTTDNR